MHTSPSIYVRYRLTCDPRPLDPALAGREVYTIIWTTTPWTLPASLAVAFHPDFEYVALAQSDYIVAQTGLHRRRRTRRSRDRQPANSARPPSSPASKAAQLERTTFQHPFLDRSILGVLADYVTADQGTGAVHTAPAHGADDFYTGQRYGLDQTCRRRCRRPPARRSARMALASPPPFEGKTVWQANPIIVAMLEEHGALLAVSDLEHSYPHCWRCHNPVIFRATEQWFISHGNADEARRRIAKRPSASARSKKSTRSSGIPRGARSASPT